MIPVRKSYNQEWLPNLFNDFFDTDWMPKTKATAPAINVSENDHAYCVEVAAPGMTKEDFKISLADEDTLVVTMEKKTESNENERKYLRREFSYTKFQQALTLPEDVDREAIEASVNDGVLKIDLGKKALEAQHNQPRAIEIR